MEHVTGIVIKNSIISAGQILTFGFNSLASEYMTLSIGGGGIAGLLCNGADPRSAYMISPRLVTCENDDECNHECILPYSLVEVGGEEV